jgi:iodotyrosine deiodinase
VHACPEMEVYVDVRRAGVGSDAGRRGRPIVRATLVLAGASGSACHSVGWRTETTASIGQRGVSESVSMAETGFESLRFTEKSPEEMVTISQQFYLEMRSRRSVREFSDRPIPNHVIRNALLAAGTAPSGAHMQPWHFAVVSDPETKRAIREAAEEVERAFYRDRAPDEWLRALQPLGTDENKPFLETAPCLIVVFLRKSTVDDEGIERKNYYAAESVGISTGILITALHLSGLATLIYTPSPMKFLNRILGRPDSERPFLILVTGYPSSNALVPVLSRYQLDQIVTFY